MKKIIFSVFCLYFAFTAIAQDWGESEAADQADACSSRRGIYLLPEYDDFALGIDVSLFLNYLGGFLSGSGRAEPNIFKQTTIYGKYFIADDRAVRAKIMLDMQNTAHKNTVPDDYEMINNPLNDNATVIDIHHISSFDIGLNLGYELRRGKGRVQGFYGGEVGLGFKTAKGKFDWANPITEANQSPSSSVGVFPDAGTRGERTTKINPGKVFKAGVGGFAGVEYFFAPQMSLGCEFDLAFMIRMEGQPKKTTERWNSSIGKVESRSGSYGDWDARTIKMITGPVYGGHIYIMFHF